MNRVRSFRQNDPTGLVRRINRVGSFFALFAATSLFADIALYHTLEIDLTDPETIRIFAPVHAPELMLDRESTDFANIGQEWLDGLSEGEMAVLLKRSAVFMDDTFRLRVGKWNVNNGFPFAFEKSDDPNAPGSLMASTAFPNPGGEFRIELSPDSEKRLQIAINRTGQFPEAKDLAAGESFTLSLLENPNPSGNSNRSGGNCFGSRS